MKDKYERDMDIIKKAKEADMKKKGIKIPTALDDKKEEELSSEEKGEQAAQEVDLKKAQKEHATAEKVKEGKDKEVNAEEWTANMPMEVQGRDHGPLVHFN